MTEPPFPAELGGDRKRAYYRVEQRRQFAPTSASGSSDGPSESGAGARESGGGASDSSADNTGPDKAQQSVNVPEDKKKQEAVDAAQQLQEVRDSIRPRWSDVPCVVICVLHVWQF